MNNLGNLVYLFANSSGFEGRIPLGSGNCTGLEYVDLSGNRFDGEIPLGIGNCTSLVEFSVVNNNLIGKIPSSLGRVESLSGLFLSKNGLSGRIPSELGDCRALTELNLSENKLEGEIPSQLGKLTELTVLKLFNNSLTGEIPVEIWKIRSLETVLLYGNKLSGQLPVEVTELKNLRNLTLSDNFLTGEIPRDLGVDSKLEAVDLTNNKFTGQIPSRICSSNRLQTLDLGFNRLNGSVPGELGRCSSLIRFRLENNELGGVIPEFGDDCGLSFVDFSGNNINGQIPSSIGNCRSLSWINLTVNEVSGVLPVELGNLAKLGYLYLSQNRLSGRLPVELGRCRKLINLDLSQNLLTGAIPTSFRGLDDLFLMDLSENRLTGGIPPSLFELERLQDLRLGGNSLGGTIPSVGSSIISDLNLSGNGLTGKIPDLSGFHNLQELDVSSNRLTGTLDGLDNIPSFVTVNFSDNRFTGPIPSNLLSLAKNSSSSFLGNPGLCADSTDIKTIKPCDVTRRNRKNLRFGIVIGMIVLGSSILTVIVAICLFYAFVKTRRRAKPDLEVSGENEGSSEKMKRVVESTANFDETYVIGKGAHGTVYKADLGSDEVYAVKKLMFGKQKGANKSMIREIQTLGGIKHRNLVKIEDFWLRSSYGLIMYEYMENRSLGYILHRVNPMVTLEWEVRYNIALGTAQGLAYLHFDCDPVVLHRDIKPGNILLDSEMEPHISDFGIAKLMSRQSSSSTPSIAVPGTIGYIAPENAFATTWTRESDVYSYGVVLLELLTRKKPVDPSFPDGTGIVEWVTSEWNGSQEVDKVVDPTLVGEFQSSSSNTMKQVHDVLVIAMKCTQNEPSKRPNMRDVVKQLEDANITPITRISSSDSL